jgi:sRNA-binding carbon storage regulator CsrA
MNMAKQKEDEEMLVVGVRQGREVIIGDHTVVTVTAIDRYNEEVKLGFDSEFQVQRASNPATTVKAAKIKARAKLGMGKKLSPVEKKPVHVASYVLDGKPQMKAAFSRSSASFPGAEMATLTDETDMSLASHQFVVVRCSNNGEAALLRFFAKAVAGWPVLDEVEAEDSTPYLLMVRTTSEKQGGDVAYYDAASLL